MNRDRKGFNLHSGLAGGKATEGNRRENHRSVFQSHAVRDAVRNTRGEAIVTTQSSVMRRRGGEFCTCGKGKVFSTKKGTHGCAHKAGDGWSVKVETDKVYNSLRTCHSCIRGRDRRQHLVQGRPYLPVSSGSLLRQLFSGIYQMSLCIIRVKIINLDRPVPRTRGREPKDE